jgi:hypothetical protein
MRFAILVNIICISISLKAWEPGLMLGGKVAAMGNCGLTSKDAWSVSNNPAMMALGENSSLGIVGQNRFGLSNLNSGALAANYIKNTSAVGIYLTALGNAAFNQYALGGSFSKQLSEKLSAGISLYYAGIQVQEYGNFGAPAFNIGFAFPFNNKTMGAVRLNNPTRSKIEKIADERMQASAALGLSQEVSKNTIWFCEAEVFESYPLDFRCGFAYKPNDDYSFMAGFATLRQSFTLGIGFLKNIQVHLGLSYHNRLGLSSTFDSQFFFK